MNKSMDKDEIARQIENAYKNVKELENKFVSASSGHMAINIYLAIGFLLGEMEMREREIRDRTKTPRADILEMITAAMDKHIEADKKWAKEMSGIKKKMM